MTEIIGSLAVAITVLFGLIALFKVIFWEDKFHEDGPDKLVHKDQAFSLTMALWVSAMHLPVVVISSVRLRVASLMAE